MHQTHLHFNDSALEAVEDDDNLTSIGRRVCAVMAEREGAVRRALQTQLSHTGNADLNHLICPSLYHKGVFQNKFIFHDLQEAPSRSTEALAKISTFKPHASPSVTAQTSFLSR